jgi:hypothetical protein
MYVCIRIYTYINIHLNTYVKVNYQKDQNEVVNPDQNGDGDYNGDEVEL